MTYSAYDLIKKLIGEIQPVGETNCDEKRLKNMEDWIFLTELMIGELIVAAENVKRYESSMKIAGQTAKEALINIKNEISEQPL